MRLDLAERLSESFPVGRVCAVLGVSRSGLYARRRRVESARAREDRHLKQQILEIHVETKRRYGTPRIERELRARGTRTSRKRVARLRRELGLQTRYQRRYRRAQAAPAPRGVAANVLNRRFQAAREDQIWVGDITFLHCGSRYLYLAVLLDIYSRRVVGWHASRSPNEALARRALEKALAQRRPLRGFLHHTDRGSPYRGLDYSCRLESAGGVASMSRRGDCWDNAMAESFFKTLKAELGDRFSNPQTARRELFAYIEGFYNTQRLHSALGYVSPAQFERQARVTSVSRRSRGKRSSRRSTSVARSASLESDLMEQA